MRQYLLAILFLTTSLFGATNPDHKRVTVYLADGSTVKLYQFRFCGDSAGPRRPCGEQLRIGGQNYTVLNLRRLSVVDPTSTWPTYDVYFKDGSTQKGVRLGFARLNGVENLSEAKNPLALHWLAMGSEVKEVRIEHGDQVTKNANPGSVCEGTVTEAGSVGMKSFGFGARCGGTTYGFYSENADLIDVTRTLQLGDNVRVQYAPKSVKRASDGSVMYAEFLRVEKQ